MLCCMLKYWHIDILFFTCTLQLTCGKVHVKFLPECFSVVNEYIVDTYVGFAKEIFHGFVCSGRYIGESGIKRRNERIRKNNKMSRNPFKNSLQLFTIELYCGR